MKRVAALLVLLAVPASGQQVTTDCLNLPGSHVECTTRKGSTPQGQADQLANGRALVAPYRTPPRESSAPSPEQRLMADMSHLIAAGRCEDAVQMALRNGRMDLAERAKAFCTHP